MLLIVAVLLWTKQEHLYNFPQFLILISVERVSALFVFTFNNQQIIFGTEENKYKTQVSTCYTCYCFCASLTKGSSTRQTCKLHNLRIILKKFHRKGSRFNVKQFLQLYLPPSTRLWSVQPKCGKNLQREDCKIYNWQTRG